MLGFVAQPNLQITKTGSSIGAPAKLSMITMRVKSRLGIALQAKTQTG